MSFGCWIINRIMVYYTFIKTEAVQNTIGRDDDDKTTCRRAAGVLIIASTAWGGVGMLFRWLVEVGCSVIELNC